ncbi:YybH family protein [Immundisolibacter sp.]
MTPPEFETPAAAEAAFYKALEAADTALMQAVWDDGPDLVCVHPMWPELHGHRAIFAAWRRMFAAGPHLTVATAPVLTRCDGELATHVVHEQLGVRGDDNQPPPVVATNVYRRTDAGWRMILHHASPTPTVTIDEDTVLH